MNFRKILCPTDFSKASHVALEMAARLAKADDAELVVINVWDLPVYGVGDTLEPSVIRDVQDEARRLLAADVRTAIQQGATKVTSRYVPGAAWRGIVDHLVEEVSFDLCVIGTHGRSGLRRVLLGSVAEKVVRLAPCAVLAVHPDDAPRPFHRILCPTDFRDPDDRTFALALAMIDSPSGTIDLVHVVVVPSVAERSDTVQTFTRVLETQSAVMLERLAEPQVAKAHIVARTETGIPGVVLVDLVESTPFDLVVVGTHSGSPLRHALFSSIAEKLIRHARCPVLVARARAGSSQA